MKNNAILNQETINEILSITGGTDTSLLQKMIRSYLEECPQAIDAIQDAIKKRNFDDLVLASHSLKSSSLSIGADKLAAACLTIEVMAKDNRLPDGNMDLVRNALEEIKPLLEAYL